MWPFLKQVWHTSSKKSATFRKPILLTTGPTNPQKEIPILNCVCVCLFWVPSIHPRKKRGVKSNLGRKWYCRRTWFSKIHQSPQPRSLPPSLAKPKGPLHSNKRNTSKLRQCGDWPPASAMSPPPSASTFFASLSATCTEGRRGLSDGLGRLGAVWPESLYHRGVKPRERPKTCLTPRNPSFRIWISLWELGLPPGSTFSWSGKPECQPTAKKPQVPKFENSPAPACKAPTSPRRSANLGLSGSLGVSSDLLSSGLSSGILGSRVANKSWVTLSLIACGGRASELVSSHMSSV